MTAEDASASRSAVGARAAGKLIFVAGMALLLSVAWWRLRRPDPFAAAIGIEAPDMVLQGADGSLHRLSDFRGRKVVLHFWATYCPPCMAELPNFARFQADLAALDSTDVAVLCVSVDDGVDDLARFADANGLVIPLFHHTGPAPWPLSLAELIPRTAFIDENAIIRRVTVGSLSLDQIKYYVKKL